MSRQLFFEAPRPAMRHPITDADLGLRVLVDKAKADIDILAIHGRGAHPNDTWYQLREHSLNPDIDADYINWLSYPTMLPAILPRARIMRYGYRSELLSENVEKAPTRVIAERLLPELQAARSNCSRRPLIILGHSFGGLVMLQLIVTARIKQELYPGLYCSTIGLVSFGTPFNDDGATQKLTQAVEEVHGGFKAIAAELRAQFATHEMFSNLVPYYLRITRDTPRARALCFYEKGPTRVYPKPMHVVYQGRIDGMPLAEADRHETIWVNETSGRLEHSRGISRACDHFQVNKFRNADQHEFKLLGDFLRRVAGLSTVPIVFPRIEEGWRDLSGDADWIVPGEASYFDRMTVSSIRVYEAIYSKCSKEPRGVSLRSLRAELPPYQIGDYRLKLVWQRLQENPGGQGDLAAYPKGYILAVLYMLHIEYFDPHRQPQDREGRVGVLSKSRRGQMLSWDIWTPCRCIPGCCSVWNFANEDGLVREWDGTCGVAAWAKGDRTLLPDDGAYEEHRARLRKNWWLRKV